MLLPFQESVTVVVTILLYALLQNMTQPLLRHEKLLHFLLFAVMVVTVMEYVIEAFYSMKQLTELFTAFFIAFLPIMTVVLTMLQSVLLFIAWTPIVLFVVQMLIYICDQWLIPALIVSVLLDVATRLNPSLSFHRLAQLIRKTLFSVIAASIIGLSSVLTISGLSWFTVRESIVSPVKKVVEQNIPIIGSLLVEGISLLKGFQVTATTLTGWTIVTTMLLLAFTPTCILLMKAFTMLLLGAITEPILDAKISQLFDDLGHSLLMLCAISLLLAIGFTLTWLILFLLFQIGTGKLL